MSMFTASNETTLVRAAVAYFYEGMSVLPLMGKQSVRDWKIRQQEIAIPELIHSWNHQRILNNVGIVCGAVSNNLVVMDLDGQAAIEAFERQFPYLLDTFTVLTGSGKGKHLYFRVDDLPPTTRLVYANHQAIELRANGCYVVAPPSLHPDTHAAYRAAFSAAVRRLPHLNGVKEWLYVQLTRKQKSSEATGQRSMGVVNTSRWAEVALTNECQAVRNAKEGDRNNQLFRSAYNLGQIIADNRLPGFATANELLKAAKQAGLTEEEAFKTIQSGINTGMAKPRSTQWRVRNQ